MRVPNKKPKIFTQRMEVVHLMVFILKWLFSLTWWAGFKTVSHIGAPIVCGIGIVWYVYDRYTGGV